MVIGEKTGLLERNELLGIWVTVCWCFDLNATVHALHDGNPVDWENQVRNTVGIIKKIGLGLLSYRIIMLDFQRDPNLIPEIISSK